MIREAIDAIANQGRSLAEEEAAQAMEEIMTGQATAAQIGALLVALRMKGETVDEMVGMARVMREKAQRVPLQEESVVDTCGTGGDGKGSFNVSTAAAFVAAGAGARVAKHGNRAMSSRCGSADLLEALGAKVDLAPDGVRRCLQATGVGFMFAPLFHPAMAFAAGPRREIGIRTLFNLLGPLTNPAGAQRQLLGVAAAALGEKMAQALRRLGCQHALVVHGEEGLDELSVAGPSLVWEVQGEDLRSYRITPEEAGLRRASPAGPAGSGIEGGSPQENAAALRQLLDGRPRPLRPRSGQALREVVLLNAGAALLVAGRAADLRQGVALAAQAIDSGAARRCLERFIAVSQSLAG